MHSNSCGYRPTKIEATTLVPPKDLECVPDEGDFPCLSEGPTPPLSGTMGNAGRLEGPSLGGKNVKTVSHLIIYGKLLQQHLS